jgi:hypothetical protein
MRLLTKLVKAALRHTRRHRPARTIRRRPVSRPALEPLEDRPVPSTGLLS